MKRIIMIIGAMVLASPAIAQIARNKDSLAKISCGSGKEITLSSLGYTRINFKDGSIKKNCIIKEIKPYWIVFLKDKVLHDEMIDKIKYIELEDGISAIYFDDKNNPVIKKIE